MTYKLLIVDDELPNLRLLERLFRRDYTCLTASSGAEAIKLLEQHDVAVVITDQRMPEMTGIELLRQTADLRPHMVRILLTGYMDVEALVEALNSGLVNTYLSKPWSNEDLKRRIVRAIEHYERNKKRNTLVLANERLTERLKQMTLDFVHVLGDTLKAHDQYMYDSGIRVARYAALMGERLGLTDEAATNLASAATLHEIGGVKEPTAEDLQLSPAGSDPGSLLQPERAARILSHIPELRDVAEIIRFYQENFDGTGSPKNLVGEQIPLSSRILRVAHEYDRMTSPRNSALTLSHAKASADLLKHSGEVFDPIVVHTFALIGPAELSDPYSIKFGDSTSDFEFSTKNEKSLPISI
ncbi:MAG: response regulator [Pyrinomonadaceae bacterium]|nr:response regulator [Pyrinomonadaceae bacterium]